MTASKNENKLNVCKHEQQTKSGGWEGQEVGEGGVGAVAPFTELGVQRLYLFRFPFPFSFKLKRKIF